MKIFEEYIKNYDLKVADIKRKYLHSYRVQKLAEKLARSLNMDNSNLKLAGICGLFHDIGRFEQFTKYHSYVDHETVDHGDLGYKILNEDLINSFNLNEEEKSILLLSTKYHNKYFINENMSDRESTFCKLIRDADKLDILRQFVEQSKIHSLLDGDITVSKDCHDDFMNHKQILWTEVKTKGDNILVFLGLIWDINYKKSFQIIEDENLYKTIKNTINNPSFDVYFQMIEEKIKEELE